MLYKKVLILILGFIFSISIIGVVTKSIFLSETTHPITISSNDDSIQVFFVPLIALDDKDIEYLETWGIDDSSNFVDKLNLTSRTQIEVNIDEYSLLGIEGVIQEIYHTDFGYKLINIKPQPREKPIGDVTTSDPVFTYNESGGVNTEIHVNKNNFVGTTHIFENKVTVIGEEISGEEIYETITLDNNDNINIVLDNYDSLYNLTINFKLATDNNNNNNREAIEMVYEIPPFTTPLNPENDNHPVITITNFKSTYNSASFTYEVDSKETDINSIVLTGTGIEGEVKLDKNGGTYTTKEEEPLDKDKKYSDWKITTNSTGESTLAISTITNIEEFKTSNKDWLSKKNIIWIIVASLVVLVLIILGIILFWYWHTHYFYMTKKSKNNLR